MTDEAALVYAAATNSMGILLSGLTEWARDMLEGSEQAEVRHHIVKVAKAYHDLTAAVADHNRADP